MAYPFFDAIKVAVSGTPGTGAITTGSALSGFRAMSNVPPSTVLNYRADDGSAFEIGSGLWNGTTLTRGLKYSSSGSLLSLSSAAVISLIVPADDVQPHIGGGKWASLSAVPNTTTPTAFGTAGTAVGTAAAVAPSISTYLSRQHRQTMTSGAAATSGAGFILSNTTVSVSATGFMGGFEFICRFGINTFTSGSNRLQVGVAAATTVSGNPSALVNSALIGLDAGDTNLFFMSNDGSGTATRVDTGVAAAANGFYEVTIWANPGERRMYWNVSRLDNGTGGSGTVTATADIPANDTLLIPQVQLSTASSTTAVALAFQSMYVRSSF